MNFFILKIKLCSKLGLIGKFSKWELKSLCLFHIAHTTRSIPRVLISQESNKTLALFSFYCVTTAVFVSLSLVFNLSLSRFLSSCAEKLGWIVLVAFILQITSPKEKSFSLITCTVIVFYFIPSLRWRKSAAVNLEPI